jgi:hypothetical protein
MENVLPELFEGHAPITLQNAFHDTLEALESWIPGEREPCIFLSGFEIPVSRVLSVMARCTDFLPRRSRSVIEAVAGAGAAVAEGAVFADGARLVMPMYLERVRSLRVWPVMQTTRDIDCAVHSYAGA